MTQSANQPSSRSSAPSSALLLLFLFSAALPSLSAPAAPTQDALAVARSVDAHYNRLHSLQAHFTEQYDGLGMHRIESGTLTLQKPGKMRWDYTSTPGKLFVLDGKFAWFYSPGESQVQRIPAKQLDDLRSPLRFLLGHTKIESELSDLRITMYENAGKATRYTLSGIPKGEEKRITRISLSVIGDGLIQNIEIEEADGAKTNFVLTDEQPNPTLPESTFRYTPPRGIPIADGLPPV